MQKISFGDREYVKASEAAKRFKYTQDYVGQLCRAKKVDARLVGRVWYVNLESITEYRKGKHATQKTTVNSTPRKQGKSQRQTVEPVVRPKTARQVQELFPKEARLATRHIAATYSRDNEAVIPVLSAAKTKKEPTVNEPIKKRSVTIKVRPNSKKFVKYQADKIPEITLFSKLKVTDEIQDLVPKKASDKHQNNSVSVQNSTDVNTVSASTNVASTKSVNFHPASVPVTISPKVTAKESSALSKPKSRRFYYVLYFLSVFFAAVFILGGGYFNEVGKSNKTSGVTFSFALAVEKVLEIAP